MEVNEYQVGGDHYVRDYQHWDFVIDTGMHYLLACATKYITRWRKKKNGLEDLKKPIHYLAKAEDAGIEAPTCNSIYVDRFVQDMEPIDSMIIRSIMSNEFDNARNLISALAADVESGADRSYVDQD